VEFNTSKLFRMRDIKVLGFFVYLSSEKEIKLNVFHLLCKFNKMKVYIVKHFLRNS